MEHSFDPYAIAVLRGGETHHTHSLKTGATYLAALQKAYQSGRGETLKPIRDIYIDKQGKWHSGGFPVESHDALKGVRIAANALHGSYGADGKVQRLLESLGIAYTGSGVTESAIHAHHSHLKKAYTTHELRTPRYFLLNPKDDPRERAHYIFNHFHMPVVLIPVRFGRKQRSHVISRYDILPSVLEQLLSKNDPVVVEEYVSGTKYIVPIIEKYRNEDLYAPVLVTRTDSDSMNEYSPHDENNDAAYDPYAENSFALASGVRDDIKAALYREAARAHYMLGHAHLSAHTFIVTKRGAIYIIDSDTHPPLHATSPAGVAFEAVGAAPEEVALHIVRLGGEGI